MLRGPLRTCSLRQTLQSLSLCIFPVNAPFSVSRQRRDPLDMTQVWPGQTPGSNYPENTFLLSPQLQELCEGMERRRKSTRVAQSPGKEGTSRGVYWEWGPTFLHPELPLAGPHLHPPAMPRAPPWEP